jgi:hypothetical protein
VVAVVVGVVDVAELLDPPPVADLAPVAEGTLGRYSWPEGAAPATDAAIVAATAPARQRPAAVLMVVVVKASGGRRY